MPFFWHGYACYTRDEMIAELRKEHGLPDDWEPIQTCSDEERDAERAFWTDEAVKQREEDKLNRVGIFSLDR